MGSAREYRKEEVMDQKTLTEWFPTEEIYFDKAYVELINEIMKKNGWSKEYVFNEKEKWPNRKVWRIISCVCIKDS